MLTYLRVWSVCSEGGFLDKHSLRSADSTLTKSSTLSKAAGPKENGGPYPTLPPKITAYIDTDSHSQTTEQSYELGQYTDFVVSTLEG